MATEIVLMPDVDGAGDIVEYCIELGDEVFAGDPILVIESDKASMEVPSSVKGTVTEWLVQLGDSVAKDHPLAVVSVSDKGGTKEPVVEDDCSSAAETVTEIKVVESNMQPDSVVIQSTATDEIVKMPEAGGQGDIIEFYVAVGDVFAEGDALVLVESDKAAMDVPASFSGEVVEIIATLGQTVEEGVPLLRVLRTGDSASKELQTNVASVTSEKTPAIAQIQSAAERQPVAKVQAKPEIVTAESSGRTSQKVGASYAGPATRKLARELGADLSVIKGSGPRGRILKEDLKGFVKQQMSKETGLASSGTAIPAFPEVDFSRFGATETKALSGIAKATSAHMTRCWLNIPHVTLFDEVDITELESFRSTIKPDGYGLVNKPTILPFIVMVVAKALRKYPQFNSSLHPDGERIIYKDYVNIGIAVDTPAGLVVPVIRDADKKSVSELMLDINELAAKAKARKLKVEDMQGGCFTVSSLGATGGTGFTPIINGPEVAILGVAKADIKPVWIGQEFQPRKKLPLCLSFDHRVINGAEAGHFMVLLNQCLSQVASILL